MDRKIIVSLSVGTAMFLAALCITCVGVTVLLTDGQQTYPQPDVYRPRPGIAGEVQRSMNELKYGPVNLEAAKEVKRGGLFDRLRDRRQARVCPPIQQCNYVQTVPTVQSVPYQVIRTVVDPTDCNYAYVSNPIVQTGINAAPSVPSQEYPAINPLELESINCSACDPRSEIKTGSFVCSNCRKKCVGEEWHTDWSSDGLPITFLCERCYSNMTPTQRQKTYQAYVSRQARSTQSTLLHQEIAK